MTKNRKAATLILPLLVITSCAAGPVQPTPTATTSASFTPEQVYELGETIKFENGVLLTIRGAGNGEATVTAVGASAGENIQGYNVYVENHTDGPLDLNDAALQLQYQVSNTTYLAPVVSDIANESFGLATASIPSPVPEGKASNGAWVFAIPEDRDGATLELFLGDQFRTVYFQT